MIRCTQSALRRAVDGRRLILRWLIALLSPALLTGCVVGISVLGVSQGEVRHPWRGESWDVTRVYSSEPFSEPAPSAQLLHARGEPDARRILPDDTEEWIYRDGFLWRGVILHLVILPLPLMVPVGREHVTFIVDDGLIVGARSSTTAYGFRCLAGLTRYPCGTWDAFCGSAPPLGFTAYP